MTRIVSSVVARWLGAGRSLPRTADRLERAAVVAAAVLGLVVVPIVAATSATARYEATMAAAVQQIAGGTRAMATLQADSQTLDLAAGAAGVAPLDTAIAPASWETPDGVRHQGPIVVERGLKAGASVPVWVNADGTVTEPPATRGDAVAAAVGIGLRDLVGLELVILIGFWSVRRLLDRLRMSSWETEWAQVEPTWSRRNR